MPERYRLASLPPELRSRIKVNPLSGCWEWQHDDGPDPYRYGVFKLGEARTQHVYRITYRLLVGPVDPSHVLDHVFARGCRAKSCCWPAHLEPVPRGVNTARGNRANIVDGIAPFVLRRIANGTASEGEREFAEAAWMLPLDFHPDCKRPVPVAQRRIAPAELTRRASVKVIARPVIRASDRTCGIEGAMWNLQVSRGWLDKARRNGDGPPWFIDEDGSVRYSLSAMEHWLQMLIEIQNLAA